MKGKQCDLCITMEFHELRQIVAGLTTAEQLFREKKITADKPKEEIVKFFGYFEACDDEFLQQK